MIQKALDGLPPTDPPEDRRWQQMWDLFHDACEVEDREGWLRAHCDDPGLVGQVMELLDAVDQADDDLLASDIFGFGKRPPEHRPFEPGERLGPYQLRCVLGEGGMGRVFLADQDEPIQRTVALKVIKRGLDSDEVVARFEAERQILARLSHPNVAQVLDAGLTPDGRPFFAMEAVDGEPINAFCDARRLGLDKRLRLMIDVCSAVQHAHHKGILHRDLKPSNVLVADIDGTAVPKVIDFGIAKALDDREPSGRGGGSLYRTRFGQILGTPEFMSPEQSTPMTSSGAAVDVDSRTDVYTLGVMLYFLLAGHLPTWDSRTPSTMAQGLGQLDAEAARIAEARSTRPDELRHSLRGELQWIVGKAMAEDRDLRYASCSELASSSARRRR